MINLSSRDFDSGPWTEPQAKPATEHETHAAHVVQAAHATDPHVCPYCQQERPTDSSKSVHRVLTKSVHQFVFGLVLFVFCVFRVARLAVASALCLVGFIGNGFRRAGLFVAHPDDRRLLSRRTFHGPASTPRS